MKIIQYAMPLAFTLLIVAFLSGLPNLRSCAVAGEEEKRGSRLNIPLLLLCLVYAVTAFLNLGNTKSPQSFISMEGSAIPVSATEDKQISRLGIFCGVGTGGYDIEYSTDGVNWQPLCQFQQSHVEVLKWNYVEIDESIELSHLRMVCTYGRPYLGELALFDGEGNRISMSSWAAAVCDEQELVPSAMNYMNSSHFDEIYHVRTAWEHLEDIWPYEISHPPLGKLIISAGISLLGMTPFGWRFSGTLFGCLMLPLMYLFIKKLFKSEKTAFLGTVVFAADFMHFTQTRIATIDTYGVFFMLLMYLFMYVYVSEGDKKALALSGICFGLGAASKWTCLYSGAGLAVIWLISWLRRFRDEGKAALKDFWKNVGLCLGFFVLIPGFIYYLSYIPYGRAEGCLPFSGEYTKLVLDNQQFMFSYHSGVTAEHPYSSRWYQWIFNIRPILYYLEYFDDGTRSSITAFLNPVTCWGGLMCLFVCLYMALVRKDRRAEFILLGWLAQILPWVFVKRLTFEYHYFPCTVFLVLAIAYVFELFRLNRKDWLRWCLPAAGLAVLLFVMFYPVLSGAPISNALEDRMLGWLPTWPI